MALWDFIFLKMDQTMRIDYPIRVESHRVWFFINIYCLAFYDKAVAPKYFALLLREYLSISLQFGMGIFFVRMVSINTAKNVGVGEKYMKMARHRESVLFFII